MVATWSSWIVIFQSCTLLFQPWNEVRNFLLMFCDKTSFSSCVLSFDLWNNHEGVRFEQICCLAKKRCNTFLGYRCFWKHWRWGKQQRGFIPCIIYHALKHGSNVNAWSCFASDIERMCAHAKNMQVQN